MVMCARRFEVGIQCSTVLRESVSVSVWQCSWPAYSKRRHHCEERLHELYVPRALVLSVLLSKDQTISLVKL